MRASLLVLATTIAYVSAQAPTITAAPGSLPLGAQCSSREQCAGGADCYATNSMLIPACGNFQAACSSNEQCAFNACNEGFCNGPLLSTTAQGPSGAPEPTVTAAPGSLELGAECANDAQCAGGAQCWASNAMLIRRCGNFNAACTSDSQCAFNICNNGLCNGLLPSTTAQGPSGAPEPTVTAAPGSLALGAECANSAQCAGGAECWASNVMVVRRCGNFNAGCTSDSHCAFNSCNNGLCNGLVLSTTAQGPSGAPSPTVTAAPGSLELGAECANTAQCAGGAQCWASNAMLILRCGNFNAECTTDAHCAFNTCNNGLCNGLLPSTTAEGPSGRPSPTVTAAPGSLPLGAECANTAQCAGGAQCWASNAMLILRCGNFNAECTTDAHCAFNTCNNGLCNGFIASSSGTAAPTGTAPTPPIPTVTASPGSLPLGAPCSNSEQCANRAQCYATNSNLIPSCGNFQASCTMDDQCAFNTCRDGFCSGLKPSGSLTTVGTRTTGGSNPTAPAYTGAASKNNVAVAGLFGAVVAVFAL